MRTLAFFGCMVLCNVLQAQENPWKGLSADLSHGNLKVSENKRFLQFEDGLLFFIWAIRAGNCSIV